MTFLIVFFLRWLRQRALSAEVRCERGEMIFAARDVKAIYGFGCLLAASILFALAAAGSPQWSLAIPGAFVVLFLWFWPADLVVTPTYIIQRSWWGIREKMAWDEVIDVSHRSGDRSTFVLAADGREIHHTGLHADPARFQAEVKLRTPVARVADWDAVPTLLPALR